MIQFNKTEGVRILELGGGQNRHPQVDVNMDVRPGPGVDFAASFEEPLPIQSGEFDAVYCAYCLEHLSWRKVPQFLSEVFRVLKPGGRAVFLTPDTRAQIAWLTAHPEGWDGKSFFESASCVLFGDCDYPENSHKAFLDPAIVHELFSRAGFQDVITRSWGERSTDMLIDATKAPSTLQEVTEPTQEAQPPTEAPKSIPEPPRAVSVIEGVSREELFDKHYWNGGKKFGGYAREGYWDFPVHHRSAEHVLSRKPTSVLEVGASRGYVLKRIQDAGIPGVGVEISKHCVMTAVADDVKRLDVCTDPLPEGIVGQGRFDLCYSLAVLEHIPEGFIGEVIRKMARVSQRGLHGIDFGHKDDAFDKTHVLLRPREWWITAFHSYAPGYPVEIVDKEELEAGGIPESVLKGDGKVKVNVGSATVMYHHGWLNIDVNDLAGFANHYGYQFLRHDVSKGLPFGTGSVDAIHMSHVLEHFSYADGARLLGECRRVLKPDGVVRIAVPDAERLNALYSQGPQKELWDFDEINDGCEAATTAAGKLWALLHEGHHAIYDDTTLSSALAKAGFEPTICNFRRGRLTAEVLDMFQCLSLYAEGIPVLG